MANLLKLVLLITLLLCTACSPPQGSYKKAVVQSSSVAKVARYAPVDWRQLPGWVNDNQAQALKAFKRSCSVLRYRSGWQQVCAIAVRIDDDDRAARAFFEHHFTPWQVHNKNGGVSGMITGYYVPELQGRRKPDVQFRYPVYARPDDMLEIDLTSVYPELAKYRLRGRVDHGRVVPYFNRGQIDSERQPLLGYELCWVDDAVELFFLHVQGSGVVTFADGSHILLNYADQNGYPYRSIGKLLIKRGEISREQMSMQNIVAWGRKHPDKIKQLLAENPSYIFFRILDQAVTMPPGALGVPLTPQRSIAVDSRYLPLGAPVYMATTWPGGNGALQRLMVAQDRGGAIKGRVRADLFWGVGRQAGDYAGKMKQPGSLWLLLPRGMAAPQ